MTLAVFLITLVLMLTRPRGLNEAWAAIGGGLLMLLLRLETWKQAWMTVAQGGDVLLFLLALMLLSALLDASGFFDWAAMLSIRLARGDGRALYRNIFLLGIVITAFLSLDTTAIILTPIVLAFVVRLNLPAKPYLIACAMAANTGSLLMPISNLTNLMFQSRLHFAFEAFTLRMALPQLAAATANYFILRRLFRKEISPPYATEGLPDQREVISDRIFFRSAVGVLVFVLVGYFAGSFEHVPAYLVAFAGCAVLMTLGLSRKRVSWTGLARDIAWPLFPFVVGLFVVIRGVENLGLAPLAARRLEAAGQGALGQIFVSAFGTGFGSNVVNNIPMALLSLSALSHVNNAGPAVYGALLGCNIGPNLTITGSLATMLVIASARKKGQDLSGVDFFKTGLIAMPLVLIAACLALAVTFLIASHAGHMPSGS